MMLRGKKIIGIAIAVALALVSCNRHTIYSHYESVDINGWGGGDSVIFCVNNSTDSIFNEQLGLRINSDYPFRNLSLIIEQHMLHTTKTLKRDTLNLTLADEDGFFLGEGLSIYQYDIDLGTIVLPSSDTLEVSVVHNMRRENLTGIAAVGITLQKEP